jgi:hypothetical protein
VKPQHSAVSGSTTKLALVTHDIHQEFTLIPKAATVYTIKLHLCTGFLVGKLEEKRPQVRPRRRWENNINMDLQEVGYGVMDWIELAQDRDRWRALVNAAMKFRAT